MLDDFSDGRRKSYGGLVGKKIGDAISGLYRRHNVGSDPDKLVDLYIEAIYQAVGGGFADVAIGVHMCRGNFKGHHLGAGGYESVAEKFFANTRVNHFLLEYDTLLLTLPQIAQIGMSYRSSTTPRRCEPFCWQVQPQQPVAVPEAA